MVADGPGAAQRQHHATQHTSLAAGHSHRPALGQSGDHVLTKPGEPASCAVVATTNKLSFLTALVLVYSNADQRNRSVRVGQHAAANAAGAVRLASTTAGRLHEPLLVLVHVRHLLPPVLQVSVFKPFAARLSAAIMVPSTRWPPAQHAHVRK